MITGEDRKSFVYAPGLVSIRPGGTVTWKSTSGVHTASAYHPDTGKPWHMPKDAEPFDSGLIQEGETFSHTFETPGVYLYYCMPHESNGMVGAVIVGDPDPSGEPGMEDPRDGIPAEAKERLSSLQDDIGAQLDLPIVADVSMRTQDSDYVFVPELVNVRRGGAIRFESPSGVHTATAYHPGNGEPQRVPEGSMDWNSDLLSQGQSYSINLQRPGVYDYFCMPHEGNGMVASIIVGIPGDTDAEPGLAEVQDEMPEAAATKLADLNDRATQQIESGELRSGNSSGGTNDSQDTTNDTNNDTNNDSGGSGLPEANFDGYLSDTSNFDGSAKDKTGQDSVTIDVGAQANGNEFGFGPAAVYISPGTTVEWNWVGEMGHNVVAEDGSFMSNDGEFDTQSSGTYERTFDSTGTIKYYCGPHKSMGMKGGIIVTDAGQSSDSSSDSSSSDSSGGELPELALDGYLSNTSNFDGSAKDKTSQDNVTIDVGAQANGNEFGFGPAAVYISPGTTVEWNWVGEMGHNVVAEDGSFMSNDGEFDTQSSGTYERTFDSTGTIKYYCGPHKSMGMKGAIVVTDAGGSSDSSTSSSSDQPQTKQDSAVNYAFDPEIIQIQPGDSVEWTIDEGAHTITSYHPDFHDKPQRIPDGAASFDSGSLSAGDTFEHTFETEGVYDYYCFPHEGMGMVGTVVVGSPTDGEPGLTAPQDGVSGQAVSKLEDLNQQVQDGS
jgi:halocyanin-like protein